ncbi:hypothetical protein GE061_004010 [Apolygus lucorum]|uniref:Transmembrane protein 138 n=1 Tax=Apolygus lucorum TaxID=248454 RepID=A0A8S9WY21_APOLU|nr:hypothetical protein GE061_004010 [Apolygus lucorum]
MKSIYVPISLTTNAYIVTLAIQTLFIILDIAVNELLQWSDLREHLVAIIIVFGRRVRVTATLIQDVILLLAAMVLGHTLFRTHVFKAGFVKILLDRFKFTIIFMILYMFLTIVYQLVVVSTRWSRIEDHVWPTGFTFLFATHRLIAIFYYYFYKRASLRVSDARFYDEEWVKHAFAH